MRHAREGALSAVVSWGLGTVPNASWSVAGSAVICALYKRRRKLEKNAILKIENKLRQKNLIMYQVGTKTRGRKALFPLT